ncbi:MAG: hypothetical protein U5P41_05365 [Gammaproteobacteria bacterium]|nr:hypothetical protein [Gammaproteobacteria bacterium]
MKPREFATSVKALSDSIWCAVHSISDGIACTPFLWLYLQSFVPWDKVAFPADDQFQASGSGCLIAMGYLRPFMVWLDKYNDHKLSILPLATGIFAVMLNQYVITLVVEVDQRCNVWSLP